MSVLEETRERVDEGTGQGFAHLEHPERPGFSWCGLEIRGAIRYLELMETITCCVCADLEETELANR